MDRRFALAALIGAAIAVPTASCGGDDAASTVTSKVGEVVGVYDEHYVERELPLAAGLDLVNVSCSEIGDSRFRCKAEIDDGLEAIPNASVSYGAFVIEETGEVAAQGGLNAPILPGDSLSPREVCERVAAANGDELRACARKLEAMRETCSHMERLGPRGRRDCRRFILPMFSGDHP